MTAISADNGCSAGFRVGFNDGPRITELHPRFDNLDCVVEAFSRGLNYTDGVWIGFGFIPNVVCLVEIAMVTTVIEGNINVYNVAVL